MNGCILNRPEGLVSHITRPTGVIIIGAYPARSTEPELFEHLRNGGMAKVGDLKAGAGVVYAGMTIRISALYLALKAFTSTSVLE